MSALDGFPLIAKSLSNFSQAVRVRLQPAKSLYLAKSGRRVYFGYRLIICLVSYFLLLFDKTHTTVLDW